MGLYLRVRSELCSIGLGGFFRSAPAQKDLPLLVNITATRLLLGLVFISLEMFRNMSDSAMQTFLLKQFRRDGEFR